MMTDRDSMLKENLDALKNMEGSLKKEDVGKFALMRAKKLVQVFDSAADSHKYAIANFEDDNYSVHEIIFSPINLGYFSTSLNKYANT